MDRKILLIIPLIITLTFIIQGICKAEVYRWIDEDGVIQITNQRPDWWKDEYDNVKDWREIKPPSKEEREKIAREKKKELAKDKIVGDKRTKIYHLSSCPLIRDKTGKYKIPERYLVFFDSAKEARKKGYTPCRRCKPNKKTK